MEARRKLFLIGEYDLVIDEKSRLLVPSEFRKEITEVCNEKSLLCRYGHNRVLWIYPENYYREMMSRRQETILTREEEEAFAEAYYGMTFRLQWDAQGRVVLPDKILKRCRLEREITLIGAGDHLVVRSREEWDRRSEMLLDTMDAITNRERQLREKQQTTSSPPPPDQPS